MKYITYTVLNETETKYYQDEKNVGYMCNDL